MHDITLSVYFSGSNHWISNRSHLANTLYTETKIDKYNLKMGFNGCGIDYGLGGNIFGSGLEKQCKQVVDKIIELLKAGHTVSCSLSNNGRNYSGMPLRRADYVS